MKNTTEADPKDPIIELIGMFSHLWESKVTIALFALALGGVAAVYAFYATEVYRSEVVLVSANSSGDAGLLSRLGGLAALTGVQVNGADSRGESLAILRSKAFIEEFIEDENLLPLLFSSHWNQKTNTWAVEDPEEIPNLRDGVRFFTTVLRNVSVDQKTGLVRLSVDWTDPLIAFEWVSKLTVRINDKIRARATQDAKAKLELLNARLGTESRVELRQVISNLIEAQMQTIIFAEAQRDYAFKIIDPPRVSEEPIRPKRPLIIALGLFSGFMIGAFFLLVKALVIRAKVI